MRRPRLGLGCRGDRRRLLHARLRERRCGGAWGLAAAGSRAACWPEARRARACLPAAHPLRCMHDVPARQINPRLVPCVPLCCVVLHPQTTSAASASRCWMWRWETTQVRRADCINGGGWRRRHISRWRSQGGWFSQRGGLASCAAFRLLAALNRSGGGGPDQGCSLLCAVRCGCRLAFRGGTEGCSECVGHSHPPCHLKQPTPHA